MLFRLGLRSQRVSLQLSEVSMGGNSICWLSLRVFGPWGPLLFVGWRVVSHVSLCFILFPSIPGWRHANAAVGDGPYFERQALRAKKGAAKNLGSLWKENPSLLFSQCFTVCTLYWNRLMFCLRMGPAEWSARCMQTVILQLDCIVSINTYNLWYW